MTDETAETQEAPSRWIRARNVALQYVGVGWFLIQVLAVLGKQLDWSPRVGDYLIIALGLGFVLTLVGALIMDPRRERSRRSRGLALAALAAVAGLVVWLIGGGLPEFRSGEYGLVHERRALFSTSTNVSAMMIVHPQTPFTPTGIRVEAGRSVEVWADGRINIGLARLVAAVQEGDIEAYDWVGPEGEINATGEPIIRADRGFPGRETCLLNQAFPYGALLLAVTPDERLTPAEARLLEPGREIVAVGSHLVHQMDVGGYLQLGVNDVYLDRAECLGPEADNEDRRASIYFQDNIGFYSVRLAAR